MLNALLTVALASNGAPLQTVPGPHLFLGERCDKRQPQPTDLIFGVDGKTIVFAKNGEIRWHDNPKFEPIRTAMITEVPVVELTPAQQKEAAEAERMHEQMFGDIPPNKFGGLVLHSINQGAQFVWGDEHRNYFFYDSKDGKLLRKVKLKYKKPINYGNGTSQMSADGKVLLLWNASGRMAFVFDTVTGAERFSFPLAILQGEAKLTTDGKSVIFVKDGVVSFLDATTGKPSRKEIKVAGVGMSGSVTLAPDGSRVAFSAFDLKGKAIGNMVVDLPGGKVTKIDSRLAEFEPRWWTPDGKHVVMHAPKYMHFVNVTTGKIDFSYNCGYPDIWDRINDLRFSNDSKQIAFAPDSGADFKLDYYVWCDLAQPRIKTLDKIGPDGL